MKKKLNKKKLPVTTVTVRTLEEKVTGGVVPAVSAQCIPGSACSAGRSGCGMTM